MEELISRGGICTGSGLCCWEKYEELSRGLELLGEAGVCVAGFCSGWVADGCTAECEV